MDLQSSLFRALAVILLALQCCVLPVCGKPAATQPGVGAVQSDRADSDAVKGASGPGRAPGADGAEGAADEEDYFDDYEDYESWKDSYDDADDMPAEQEEKKVQTVQLLSSLTGRFVHSTEDGLRSDGSMMQDPPAMFVRTTVSADTITLETADHQLLGINNKGQILLDPRNSSDIFHKFQVVKDNGGSSICQLRISIGRAECYLAFTEKSFPVTNACELDRQNIETFITIIPM